MQQQDNFEATHLKYINPNAPSDVQKGFVDKKVESVIHNTKIAPTHAIKKNDENENQNGKIKHIKHLSSGSRLSKYYCIGSEIRIIAEPIKKESSRPVLRDVIDRKTGKYNILKIISKSRIPAGANGMQAWITLCEKLLNLDRHPNLMPIYEIYESESSFYLIAEKMDGGELFDFLLKEKAIPEDVCKYIIRQVLLAVDYLHSNHLLHRDIKPENLMFRRNINSRMIPIEERYELALIDFDTCKITNLPPSQQCEIVNGRRRLVGTYGYLAPEVLKGYDYSPASDLWSIGVVLYILMTGVPPTSMDMMYDAQSSLNVLRHAEANGLDFDMPPFLDFPLARDLCKRLLTFDPKRRLGSAALALEHPWLANIPSCFKKVNNMNFFNNNNQNNSNGNSFNNHSNNSRFSDNYNGNDSSSNGQKWCKGTENMSNGQNESVAGNGDASVNSVTTELKNQTAVSKQENGSFAKNGTNIAIKATLVTETTETTISDSAKVNHRFKIPFNAMMQLNENIDLQTIINPINLPALNRNMNKMNNLKKNNQSQTKLMQKKRPSSEMEKMCKKGIQISTDILSAMKQMDTVVVEQKVGYDLKFNKFIDLQQGCKFESYKQFESLETMESLDSFSPVSTKDMTTMVAVFERLEKSPYQKCTKRSKKSANQQPRHRQQALVP